MKLRRAQFESDWNLANEILTAVVHKLDQIGKSLWSESQISVQGLKDSYKLEQLYFFEENEKLLGVVFLQMEDLEFWPEILDGDSLFFHKLAIHPDYIGQRKGVIALRLIIDHARKRGLKWVRLDCDDRKELNTFYQSAGFSYVSTKQIDRFQVVKYQLLTRVNTGLAFRDHKK